MNAQIVSQAKGRMLKLTDPITKKDDKSFLDLVFDSNGRLEPSEEERLFAHIESVVSAAA